MIDTLITKLYRGFWWVLLVMELAGVGVLAVVTLATSSWWRHLVFILAALSVIGLSQPLAILPLRAVARQISKSWSDLARIMGLTYEPDDRSLLGDRYPALRGEYRGRLMIMGFARTGYSYSNPSLEFNAPADIPRFSLAVKNPANIRFTIQPKGFFVRASRIDAVVSGDEDFNRLFLVKGEPGDYVKRAVQRIVASGFHMLNCLHRNVASIELNGSYLVCVQGRALEIEDQIALFNLLCNLAELTEQMGSVAKQEVTND